MTRYDGELLTLELGERAEACLFAESWGQLYDDLEDRWWSLVLTLHGWAALAYRGKPPAEWSPKFTANGRWAHRA